MIFKTATQFKIYKVASNNTNIETVDTLDDFDVVEEKHGDFVYAWVRAVTADEPNKNGDIFPLEEIRSSYKTFIGRNMFLDHKADSVANAVGKVIGAKLNYDEEHDKFFVSCYVKVCRKTHPQIANNIEMGIIDSVSMGASVEECECPICHCKASDPTDFCEHLNNLGRKDPKTGQLCTSINRGVNFTELSWVAVPADIYAKIFKIYASIKNGMNKTAATHEDTDAEIAWFGQKISELTSEQGIPELANALDKIMPGVSAFVSNVPDERKTSFLLTYIMQALSYLYSISDTHTIKMIKDMVAQAASEASKTKDQMFNKKVEYVEDITQSKSEEELLQSTIDKYLDILNSPESSPEDKEKAKDTLKRMSEELLNMYKKASEAVQAEPIEKVSDDVSTEVQKFLSDGNVYNAIELIKEHQLDVASFNFKPSIQRLIDSGYIDEAKEHIGVLSLDPSEFSWPKRAETNPEVSKLASDISVEEGKGHIFYVVIESEDAKVQDLLTQIFQGDVQLSKNVTETNPDIVDGKIRLAVDAEDSKSAKKHVEEVINANKDMIERVKKEVSEETKMEKKETNTVDLKKVSAFDFITRLFSLSKTSEEIKPEAASEPKADGDKPMEPKKELPKPINDIVKDLEKLLESEKAEGEALDTKLVESILEKVTKLELKDEKGEAKEEPKKEGPKEEPKKEEPKPEPKKEETKPEPKKEEVKPAEGKSAPAKKPFDFKSANLVAEFKVNAEDSALSEWHVKLANGAPVLRTNLLGIAGENEDRYEGLSEPEFGEALITKIKEANAVNEHVIYAVSATYKPCHPSHKKMQAPAESSHKKNTTTIKEDTDLDAGKVAETATEIAKKADIKEETDGVLSHTDGSQVTVHENNSPDQSGHKKEKAQIPAEYDTKLAEALKAVEKLAQENEALKQEALAKATELALKEKQAKVDDIVDFMQENDLIDVKEEYKIAAVREGADVLKAIEVAKNKAIAMQKKELLAMSDTAMEAFATSLKKVKKATVVRSATLKQPIHVDRTASSESDVEDLIRMCEDRWSK